MSDPHNGTPPTGNSAETTTAAPVDQAYIAALWEHPRLCLAIFGVQYHTPEGQQLYESAGINEELFSVIGQAEGHLLTRPLAGPDGALLLQYWRSYEDLDRWARTMPHTRWWQWLLANEGKGVAFYHEIYQVKTAEAIYEKGSTPVGPALFSSIQAVRSGEGKSKQRQAQFAEVASDVRGLS